MKQNRYRVEFRLNIDDISLAVIRECLAELGEDLNLEEEKEESTKNRIIKIHLHTDNPHLVFDACSEFGRLKQVKISEVTT
jgi:dihydroxyacetone kinase-like predicted kinase